MRQASGRVLLRTARRPQVGAALLRPALASPSPAASAASLQQSRSFFGLFGKKKKPQRSSLFEATPEPTVILEQDNLFHPLSQSPFEALREKGERIRTYAICPVSYEKYHQTKTVKYECPDCGFPTHASKEMWEEGHKEHEESCPRLREVNEDEHDLRSGRRVVEYENMPGA